MPQKEGEPHESIHKTVFAQTLLIHCFGLYSFSLAIPFFAAQLQLYSGEQGG